jgi:hypothetical protein
MELGVLGALEAALGDALLDQLHALGGLAREDQLHAEGDHRIAALGDGGLAFVFGARRRVLGELLVDERLQALGAIGLRAGAQGAALHALVDHLLAFARQSAWSASWAISM